MSSALVAATGCGADEGEVVFGITSDYRAGVDLDYLEVTTRQGDREPIAATIRLGAAPGQRLFPIEVPVESVAHGDAVSLSLAGYLEAAPNDLLLVERLASTEAAAGEKLLYRVHLDSRCRLTSPGSPVGRGPCPEGTTCVAGSCVDPHQPASALPRYEPGWASSFGDACKPSGAGAPVVIVGQGQTDYFPLDDGATVPVEAGPQGGHHVWVAARLKNLRRSQSITTVSGEIPQLGLAITPLKVSFTLALDEGGYCKLHGLRFQIDVDGGDVGDMLGKKMKVTVRLDDPDGDVGIGERWVTLSDAIL